jgi:hypothetical protein
VRSAQITLEYLHELTGMVVADPRDEVPMNWLSPAIAALVAVTLAVGACSDGSTADGSSAQDVTTTSACTVVAMKDNHTMTADELAKLDDPVANFILKGDGCPLTFTDIQAKLLKTDPCAQGEPGLSTRLVTDRAQLLGKPDSYRAVVKRECQKRTDHELFMSVFGIGTRADAQGKVTDVGVPQTTLELIGEQKTKDAAGKTSGVFNFYAREDNQWKFFGSSADFVTSGYECNADGACIPKAATNQRCASCHVGGGLVMKELQSPWVNWEGARSTPGSQDVIGKNPALFGTQGNGVDLETSVERGNQDDWIPARVALLKKLGLKDVLRPLFCSTDMNLVSRNVPNLQGLAFDTLFRSNGGFVTFDQYNKAVATAKQRVVDGRSGQQLIGAGGKPAVDTVFGFTFPERSTQDEDYVTELQNQHIVDIDFVKDVLIVDFTRPLYSPTRCKMLDSLPDVAETDMQFEKVKAAVIDKLKDTTDPALSQLLANLKDPTDAAVHDVAVSKFGDACSARLKSEPDVYVLDLLRYASHVRKAAKRARNAKNGGIIEFPETLPVDDLAEPTAGFDPVSCKLP